MFLHVRPRKATLSDANSELIDLYLGIKKRPAEVWRAYSAFKNTKREYLRVRRLDPAALEPVDRAARLLYLNRTCFKGNWRHNLKGEFNVGYGGQSRRWVLSEDYLTGVSNALRRAVIECGDFEDDTATIITSDPYKVSVGGVPHNSLLIMVPTITPDDMTPHFTVLRVAAAAPTPLSRDVQQTYFELQKKSMPELDVFTQSELQWGALSTNVLGMFYPSPSANNQVEFSGDVNNFVSPHKYKVYAPDDKLLNLITNALVPAENRFCLGKLRMTECRLPASKHRATRCGRDRLYSRFHGHSDCVVR